MPQYLPDGKSTKLTKHFFKQLCHQMDKVVFTILLEKITYLKIHYAIGRSQSYGKVKTMSILVLGQL